VMGGNWAVLQSSNKAKASVVELHPLAFLCQDMGNGLKASCILFIQPIHSWAVNVKYTNYLLVMERKGRGSASGNSKSLLGCIVHW
jgi:hypothetical protein